MRQTIHYALAAFFLCVMTFLVYVNSLSNQFTFDDKGLIRDNRFIREGTTLQEIFTTNYRFGAQNPNDGLYRPLVMLTYVLNSDRTLDPFPLHLWNVILNALNTAIFFILIVYCSGSLTISLFSAFIFGFHPIHTEVVANISGRPEILCTLLLFITWIIIEKNPRNSLWKHTIASFFLFCALLSKETAVMFPVMIGAYDFLKERLTFSRRIFMKYGIIIGTVVLYLVIRLLVLGETAPGSTPEFYDNPIANTPFLHRIPTAWGIFIRYCGLLVFPQKLVSDYSYNSLPLYKSLLHPVPLAAVFMGIVMIAGAIYMRKRNPLYSLAFILFFFPYLLISNMIFPIGTVMGERFMYLPSAGFALLMGILFNRLFSRWRYIAVSILILTLAAYTFKIVTRNRVWYDDMTLTSTDVKIMPDNVKLLMNMGVMSARFKRYTIAENYYHRALDIYPNFVGGLSGLGKLFYDQENYGQALIYYEKAAQIAPADPQVCFDYAMVLKQLGRFTDAERELREVLALSPTSPLVFRGLGNLMLDQKKYHEAVEYYQEAYNLGGDKQILLNNMAAASFYNGDTVRALGYIRMAELLGIQLNPEMIRTIRADLPGQ